MIQSLLSGDFSDIGIFQTLFTAFLVIVAGFFCVWIRGAVSYKALGAKPFRVFSFGTFLSLVCMAVFSFSWTEKPSLSETTKGSRAKAGFLSLLVTGGIAFIFLVAYCAVYGFSVSLAEAEGNYSAIVYVSSALYAFALVFSLYFIFSLLPLPGLDGGLILSALLPDEASEKYAGAVKYAFPLCLFICIFLTRAGYTETIIDNTVGLIGQPISSFFVNLF